LKKNAKYSTLHSGPCLLDYYYIIHIAVVPARTIERFSRSVGRGSAGTCPPRLKFKVVGRVGARYHIAVVAQLVEHFHGKEEVTGSIPVNGSFISMSKAQQFWNEEYKKAEHFALSDNASADLEKFTRWLVRRKRGDLLAPGAHVIDIGCGNGRNSLYLAGQFGMTGVGFDISKEAITQANNRAKEHNLDVVFSVADIKEPIVLPQDSADIVLDLMVSHYLNAEQRIRFRDDVYHMLKPGGFLLLKSFLRTGDVHSRKLLKSKKQPKDLEEGSYMHPLIGVAEHTWTEQEVEEFWGEKFEIHKFDKSFGHLKKGRPGKRRYFVTYLQKPFDY
jgi:SAM-dependent methyltransferase